MRKTCREIKQRLKTNALGRREFTLGVGDNEQLMR